MQYLLPFYICCVMQMYSCISFIWQCSLTGIIMGKRSWPDNVEVINTSYADFSLNNVNPEIENDISQVTIGNEGRHTATEITTKISRPDGTAVELKLNKICSMNYTITTLRLRKGQLIHQERATDKVTCIHLAW